MSKWKSAAELGDEVWKLPDHPKLEHLSCIKSFYENALFSEQYTASSTLPAVVRLTPHAVELIERSSILQALPKADVVLALFIYFSHHDILVDWQNTDTDAIREILNQDIFHERIYLPFRFGRLLYDRFNERDDSGRTDHLPYTEAIKLLNETPVGVYQLGNLISGPLGLLHGLQPRYLPPSLVLPLWHCSDTGCSALHTVKLLPSPDVPVKKAFEEITKIFSDSLGVPSEWDHVFYWMHLGNDQPHLHQPHLQKYADAPLLIADCVLGEERTKLLELALQSKAGERIRLAIASSPRGKTASLGSPADVAKRLSPEEQFQLLLLESNEQLVSLLDNAVITAAIKVPLTEVRIPRHRVRMSSDAPSELSSYGVRSVQEAALCYLQATIWQAYSSAGLLNDLQWRLRNESSSPSQTALADFLRIHGPAEALEQLVLTSRPVAEAVCQAVNIPVTEVKNPTPAAVSRILWKFGFDIPRYDEVLERFRTRLDRMNEAALVFTPERGEDAREELRSAGVNLFVSAEEFLEELISFTVWLLASDHFVATRFAYRPSNARQFVPEILSPAINVENIEFRWQPTGGNSLGVLVQYLNNCSQWISSLASTEPQDRIALQRPEEQLPFYANDLTRPFAFRHKHLWADADPNELRQYAQGFERIVKLLAQANLANVRNGLEHKREEEKFPSADAILACVARIREALELADAQRYYPKLFWLFERRGDLFGALEYVLKDYRKGTLKVYGPTVAQGLAAINYSEAFIFPAANLLGVPNSLLRFTLAKPSEYSTYWSGYPRRRKVPLQDVGIEEAQTNPPPDDEAVKSSTSN
jgi:hypothetical protein